MSNLPPGYNPNPYAQAIPNNWTDVYVERNLQAQLFPGRSPDALSFDRTQQMFTVNQAYLSPQANGLQLSRSLTSSPNFLTSGNSSQTAGPMALQQIPTNSTVQTNSQGASVPLKTQLTPQMVQQAKAFRTAVDEYRKSSKVAVGLDLDKPGTWDDLLTDIKNIEEQYKTGKTKSGSFANLLRKGFRNMGRFNAGVRSWLELLPGDAWEASLVVGGMRLIFDAAAKLDSMREETYDVIEQIPQTLANADRLARWYKDANSLQQYVTQLYVTIIDTLGVIVTWYQQSSARHAFSALGKAGSYGSRLKECLKELQRIGDAVISQGNIEMHGTLSQVSENMIESKNMLDYMCDGMNFTKDILQDQSLMFNTLISEIMHVQRERESERRRKIQQEIEKQQISARRRSNILAATAFDVDFLLTDLEKVLQSGLAFDRTKQGFAASILHSEELALWLNTPNPRPLIINAHQVHHERASSVSLFSSLMVRLLEKRHTGIVLSWFCGLHTEDEDSTTMLLNLIGQILNSSSFNPAILDEHFEYFTQSLHQYPADPMCLINGLQTLIQRQLSHTPVHLIIDSVSFYETTAHFQNMIYVIQSLANLCMDLRGESNGLKLLLTSPKVVRDLTEVLHGVSGCEILNLSPLRFQNASAYRPTINAVLG